MAAGRTSSRDFGTRAQHCVGARHLLCSSHSFELEIRLHHPHRFLNPDYSVFDCGGVVLREDKLSFSWEGDRSDLGGSSAIRKLLRNLMEGKGLESQRGPSA